MVLLRRQRQLRTVNLGLVQTHIAGQMIVQMRQLPLIDAPSDQSQPVPCYFRKF